MTTIQERLREAAIAASGNSINNGCAGCGVDANTCDEAADHIDALESSLAAVLSLADRSVQDPTALDRLILGQAQDTLAKIKAEKE